MYWPVSGNYNTICLQLQDWGGGVRCGQYPLVTRFRWQPFPLIRVSGTSYINPTGPSVFASCIVKKIPFSRLGSRGPGGDQKSWRFCPQASAKRSRRVHRRSQGCRSVITVTVVTFGPSSVKSANSTEGRGDSGERPAKRRRQRHETGERERER